MCKLDCNSIDANPNNHYNLLEQILSSSLNCHIPLRKIKINKYKHKKTNWITAGLINSIKFSDNMYKNLKKYLQIQLNT